MRAAGRNCSESLSGSGLAVDRTGHASRGVVMWDNRPPVVDAALVALLVALAFDALSTAPGVGAHPAPAVLSLRPPASRPERPGLGAELRDGGGLPEVAAPEPSQRPQPVSKRPEHRPVRGGRKPEPVRPGPRLSRGQERADQRVLQGAHVHGRPGGGDGQVHREDGERPRAPRPVAHHHPGALLGDGDHAARVTHQPSLRLERRDAGADLRRDPVPKPLELGAKVPEEAPLLLGPERGPQRTQLGAQACRAPRAGPPGRRPRGTSAPARRAGRASGPARPARCIRGGCVAGSRPRRESR